MISPRFSLLLSPRFLLHFISSSSTLTTTTAFLHPPTMAQSSSNSSSSSVSAASASPSIRGVPVSYKVPQMSESEIDAAAEDAFRRYSVKEKEIKRSWNGVEGVGVAVMWFRNDLRIIDNEALLQAWGSSQSLLPVYCFDPRHLAKTRLFDFPKTGAIRADFLVASLNDLRKNLLKRGLNLLICHGNPEDVIPAIAESLGAHTVFAHKETCSEETRVENLLRKSLRRTSLRSELKLIWGSTMYHNDDLPFGLNSLPDVYTQFRKSVESKSKVRGCFRVPGNLGPLASLAADAVGEWGEIPSLEVLGLQYVKCDRGMSFVGGESAALARLHEFFWKKDLLRVYKETRNGMLGADYSTKFSPWLASGSLSPRYIYEEVKRYEKERIANESTYWVLFELIWRDYFRFLSMKYGSSIFHLGGPRHVDRNWSQDRILFESWRTGQTGYPLIDANMKELLSTGFMSNRGRQIVCSFLVRDMGVDWRMGAEWFESCLLDYDPCSNYGNWTYGAGVGNDPREDRYFSIPKQAQVYDPEGEYVAYWLPQLRRLPREKRNFPGPLSYMNRIVQLKFDKAPSSGSTSRHAQQGRGRRN